MPRSSSTPIPNMREQLLHECVAMVKYALASGMRLPAAAVAAVDQGRAAGADASDVAALTRAHDQLAKLVAPATPRALMLMGDEHVRNRLPMLGPVGLVRRMMIAAVVSMVVFIGVTLTKVSGDNSITISTGSGLGLLTVELLWLSAAAMGASFAMLMQMSTYVVQRSYDPKYEASYWIKFFLGVMAGFIMVSLVPVEEAGTGTGTSLLKPTIALLGGFSASAVYRILTRLVETIESFFRGDPKEEIVRREQAARAAAGEETQQVRIGLAAQLVKLQQEVSAGADAGAVSQRLQEIMGGLVPSESADAPPPSDDARKQAPPEGSIALAPGTTVVAPPADPPSAPSADAPEPAVATASASSEAPEQP